MPLRRGQRLSGADCSLAASGSATATAGTTAAPICFGVPPIALARAAVFLSGKQAAGEGRLCNQGIAGVLHGSPAAEFGQQISRRVGHSFCHPPKVVHREMGYRYALVSPEGHTVFVHLRILLGEVQKRSSGSPSSTLNHPPLCSPFAQSFRLVRAERLPAHGRESTASFRPEPGVAFLWRWFFRAVTPV